MAWSTISGPSSTWNAISGPNLPANTSIRTASYRWVLSGSGTNEYYCELAAGGNPGIATEPSDVIINSVHATRGILGSLAAGEYSYGDNDSLGFNTVYVRLSDGTDPDTKSAGYVQMEGWSGIAVPS